MVGLPKPIRRLSTLNPIWMDKRHPVSTYTFNLNGEYGFFTGHDESGKQYLLGTLMGSVLTIQFSALGDCLFVWEDRAPYSSYTQKQKFLMLVHEVTIAPIVVKHFQLSPYKINICDLPSYYEEFLEDPNTVPDDRHGLYEASIAKWILDRNFIFLWDRRRYWINGEGGAVPH
jgi:hypothetical protein